MNSMDIEDLGFGCLIILMAIFILALIGTGIYATIQDINNKNNNENNYQKCICENVKDWVK